MLTYSCFTCGHPVEEEEEYCSMCNHRIDWDTMQPDQDALTYGRERDLFGHINLKTPPKMLVTVINDFAEFYELEDGYILIGELHGFVVANLRRIMESYNCHLATASGYGDIARTLTTYAIALSYLETRYPEALNQQLGRGAVTNGQYIRRVHISTHEVSQITPLTLPTDSKTADDVIQLKRNVMDSGNREDYKTLTKIEDRLWQYESLGFMPNELYQLLHTIKPLEDDID